MKTSIKPLFLFVISLSIFNPRNVNARPHTPLSVLLADCYAPNNRTKKRTFFYTKGWNVDIGLYKFGYEYWWYYAALRRWDLSEKFYNWSPYHYTNCNLIRYIDLFGMESSDTNEVRKQRVDKWEERIDASNRDVEVRSADILYYDKRHFIVNVENTKGESLAHMSLFVWQPVTTPREDYAFDRPGKETDLDSWVFAMGKNGQNFKDFTISAEFQISKITEIVKGKSKQKHYNLNTTIGISSNIGIKGSTEEAFGNDRGGGIGLNLSVGMIKAHTSAVQSFSVSWYVIEQYYGARSSVKVMPNPRTNQTHFNPQTNIYSQYLKYQGTDYKVKVYLDVDKP